MPSNKSEREKEKGQLYHYTKILRLGYIKKGQKIVLRTDFYIIENHS